MRQARYAQLVASELSKDLETGRQVRRMRPSATNRGRPRRGRPRLENDPNSNWREVLDRFDHLRQKKPYLSQQIIAEHHLAVSLSTLKRYRQRERDLQKPHRE